MGNKLPPLEPLLPIIEPPLELFKMGAKGVASGGAKVGRGIANLPIIDQVPGLFNLNPGGVSDAALAAAPPPVVPGVAQQSGGRGSQQAPPQQQAPIQQAPTQQGGVQEIPQEKRGFLKNLKTLGQDNDFTNQIQLIAAGASTSLNPRLAPLNDLTIQSAQGELLGRGFNRDELARQGEAAQAAGGGGVGANQGDLEQLLAGRQPPIASQTAQAQGSALGSLESLSGEQSVLPDNPELFNLTAGGEAPISQVVGAQGGGTPSVPFPSKRQQASPQRSLIRQQKQEVLPDLRPQQDFRIQVPRISGRR